MGDLCHEGGKFAGPFYSKLNYISEVEKADPHIGLAGSGLMNFDSNLISRQYLCSSSIYTFGISLRGMIRGLPLLAPLKWNKFNCLG